MFPALLAVLGAVLLFVAGVGVDHPRFKPQWLGFGCLALALTWPVLAVQSR